MQDPVNWGPRSRRGKGNLRMGEKKYIRRVTAEQLDQLEKVRGVWQRCLCEDELLGFLMCLNILSQDLRN